MAAAMRRSRQAVNRGVQGEADYFKLPVLARALESWRLTDRELYAVARNKICELYPEAADAILAAVEQGDSAPTFSTDSEGEYWLVCGDFSGFRSGWPDCSRQIEEICGHENSHLKLFINKRDITSANRFAKKHGNVDVVLCTSLDLNLGTTVLLCTDKNDAISLFGVSDAGFVGLSGQEARRLRSAIQGSLLEKEPRKAAALVSIPGHGERRSRTQ